jgi:anti-sigma factor RsiW
MVRVRTFTQNELEAFLDEALSPEEMARVELALRSQPKLARALAELSARRDNGEHTLGEIWRRHRVSCPTREQLGSYLLCALASEPAEYVAFHVEVVGCRFCQANLQDLRRQQEEAAESTDRRRTKYFQSSAGYLRRDRTGRS